jgi:hypothetical protein
LLKILIGLDGHEWHGKPPVNGRWRVVSGVLPEHSGLDRQKP